MNGEDDRVQGDEREIPRDDLDDTARDDPLEPPSEGDEPGMTGARGSVTTDAGLVGVVESSTGPSGDTVDVAFKMAVGTAEATDAAPALLVRVHTAAGQFERYQDEVAAMIRSITPGAAR